MTRQFEEKVAYSGFVPTSSQRQAVKGCLNGVEQVAPSDASVSMALVAKQALFHGQLTVASNAGVFKSESSRASLEALLVQLSSDVFTQLSEWKRSRFTVDAV